MNILAIHDVVLTRPRYN